MGGAGAVDPDEPYRNEIATNREVISGIIHALHIGCRWEDCPSKYGPHTMVYKRFNRWSKAGIWQSILAGLVEFDAADTQCIDSTTAKAHRCTAGGKGGSKQAIGRSRAGQTTKIHAIVDTKGRIIAFSLTEGSRHDLPPDQSLMEKSLPRRHYWAT